MGDTTQPKSCSQCGEAFVPRRRDQIYCSDTCKVRARPSRAKIRYAVCRFCGKAFEAPRGGTACGAPVCRRAYQAEATERSRARAKANEPPKVCAECGKPFTATAHNKSYCSTGCKRASLLRRRRDREYQPAPLDCVECGQSIPYKSGLRRFCGPECAKRYRERTAKWRVKGLWPEHGMVEECGLCGATERLVIDHDHECCPGQRSCGECVRGFLCRGHNVGLGLFGDDPALLRAAAEYIERHRVALTTKGSHDG